MNKKIIQLRKGVFELVILQILEQKSLYGYSLVREITDNCSFKISEGTIYPILSRVSKEGLIESEWRESSKGPPRKYYSITGTGVKTLRELENEYLYLNNLVKKTKKLKTKNSNREKNKKINPKKEIKNEK